MNRNNSFFKKDIKRKEKKEEYWSKLPKNNFRY